MGREPIDLTGKRSGKLVAIKIVGQSKKNRGVIWECKCDCGNTINIAAGSFPVRTSCGCVRKKYERKNTALLTCEKSRVKLKAGHTYEEYIIKCNECVPYHKICKFLNISFDRAWEIYDGVYQLDIDDIGSVKKPELMSAEPEKSNLILVKNKRG